MNSSLQQADHRVFIITKTGLTSKKEFITRPEPPSLLTYRHVLKNITSHSLHHDIIEVSILNQIASKLLQNKSESIENTELIRKSKIKFIFYINL